MENAYRLKNQILPLAMAVALINWTSRTLFGFFYIQLLILAIAITCVIFAAYNFAQKYANIKTLLFFAFSFLYLIVCQVVMGIEDKDVFLFLITVYGYASTIYYFTIIRYRVAVVFIIGLIPFLIHTARTAKGITIHFIIYILLFFLLYFERTRKKRAETVRYNVPINEWYYVTMSVFLALVFLVSLIAPKPNVIPRLAYVNAVIEQVAQPLGGAAAQQNLFQGINNNLYNPFSIKTQSQLDSLTAPQSDRVLFEVAAQEPVYLRIQSWDKYEDNVWKIGNEKLKEYKPVRSFYNDGIKYNVFVDLVKKAKKEGIILSALPETSEIWNYDSNLPEKRKATILNVNSYSTKFIPVPIGAIDVYSEGKNSEKIYMNKLGSCSSGAQSSWKSYDVEYITQRIATNSFEHNLIKILDRTRAESLLDMNAYKKNDGEPLDISYDNLNVLYAATEDLKSVYENYTQLPQNISDRVFKLAQKITEGKESTYDKALAIEQYFHNSDYVYDLDPPRIPSGAEAIDYFLFDSKKGFCIHYASAMVVLARACGLPARYSEGYVADEFDSSTGRFVVRDKDAHAFPEVYIPGYGWMVFEPTVSVMEQDALSIFFDKVKSILVSFEETVVNIIEIIPVWVRILSIPFFLFTLMFWIWILRRVYIHFWKKKMLKLDANKAVDRILSKIIKLLGVVNLDRDLHETPLQYGQRIYMESGIDVLDFIEIFNKSKYAKVEPTVDDVKRGIALYGDVVVCIKRRLKWFNPAKYFWFV
ncbi:MAG TPA: transglutaminase-like domain-containing protein [Acetivibrio sp.]|uniref:transglutaminase-like domain-containing protein n=1 Tax=Acetivibrio sp. TaxID=1872092 RepID=UPI002BE69177|nr:transglutaminase-like domain-containing protein [Acetivibrio sp.]HOM03652.1 transglutaminase-like domain-containing protein [Acetivibrio sp.]